MKAADASADHGKQVFAPLPVGHAINTDAMDVKFDHHAPTRQVLLDQLQGALQERDSLQNELQTSKHPILQVIFFWHGDIGDCEPKMKILHCVRP